MVMRMGLVVAITDDVALYETWTGSFVESFDFKCSYRANSRLDAMLLGKKGLVNDWF